MVTDCGGLCCANRHVVQWFDPGNEFAPYWSTSNHKFGSEQPDCHCNPGITLSHTCPHSHAGSYTYTRSGHYTYAYPGTSPYVDSHAYTGAPPSTTSGKSCIAQCHHLLSRAQKLSVHRQPLTVGQCSRITIMVRV